MTPSKVDDLIAEVMLKHPSQTARGIAAYFEAVHQHLEPLARDLEAKLELVTQENRALQRLARLEGKLEAFAAAMKQCSGQNTERTASQIHTAIDILHLDTLRRLKFEINVLVPENRALRAENEGLMPLAMLGKWVIDMRFENGCADLFGLDIQEAIKLGLLEEVMATEPCGDRCHCARYDDFPSTCFRTSDKAKVLDK